LVLIQKEGCGEEEDDDDQEFEMMEERWTQFFANK
jgi:hypothetical protein